MNISWSLPSNARPHRGPCTRGRVEHAKASLFAANGSCRLATTVPRKVCYRRGCSRREADGAFWLGLPRPIVGDQLLDRIETTANCSSYRCSIVSIFRARSRFESISRRNCTNVRIIAMLTSTARRDRSTLESTATPCSVKAKEAGGYRRGRLGSRIVAASPLLPGLRSQIVTSNRSTQERRAET